MNGPAKLLVVVVAAIVLSGAFSWWNRRSAGAEVVPWRNDLVAAESEAADAGKPVMIYFTASWCGPCRMMSESTWTDPRVGEALKPYVPVKIDVDQHRDLAMRYGVSSIPRMIVVGADGARKRDAGGAMGPDQFIQWLK